MGDLGIEAADVVKALMTPDQWQAHCWATALYYLLRLGRKDSPKQDAAKAIWWLTWIAEGDPRQVRNRNPKPPTLEVSASSDPS